jgi:hypothetical protein
MALKEEIANIDGKIMNVDRQMTHHSKAVDFDNYRRNIACGY